MVRVVFAGLAAGAALFFWGFVSWVVLTWHHQTFHPLPYAADEQDLVTALRDHLPLTDSQTVQSGAYRIPWFTELQIADGESLAKAQSEWRGRHMEGPVAYLFYSDAGSDPMSAERLASGAGLYVLASFFAALAVHIALPGRPNYLLRVGIVLAMGCFTVLMTHLNDWNFMYRPDDYTLAMCADSLISALIAGIIVAAIVRPQPKAAAA